MKQEVRIKNWQLVRVTGKEEILDLRDQSFVTVGKRAFLGKSRMECVMLPEGVSAVKTEAFRACKRLKQVSFPAENNIGLSSSAFEGCGRLQILENSERLSQIGARAFLRCRSLQNPSFGRELCRIGDEAFSRCLSLTEVTLPATLKTVGKNAFAGCTELSHVKTEDGLESLSKGIFRGCISLTEIDLASTLKELPNDSFRDCSAFTSITVPSQIERVGKRVFMGCTRLSEVTMELGVKQIGARAFTKTPRLESVVVPHSLERIGFGAFGLGFSKKKVLLYVDNEYMCRRLRLRLFLCGSVGRVQVVQIGKTIDERKRERRRSTIEQTPVHLIKDQDTERTDET